MFLLLFERHDCTETGILSTKALEHHIVLELMKDFFKSSILLQIQCYISLALQLLIN